MPSNNDFIVIQNTGDAEKIPQYKQTIPVNLYHFYIIGEIGDPTQFLDLINILKTAEEHDTIFIYLNTPGGSLQTTVQIISAMRQCSATVVTCLEGEVCSAGTLIFLAGTKHVVNPNCTFMIHNYSQWIGGKGNEVALRVKYSEQFFKKLALDLYKGFMSEEEIQSVIDGKDYWMDSDEVIRRLNARTEGAVCEPGQLAENAIINVVEQFISDNQEVEEDEPPPTQKSKSKKQKKA
jgi:ATP-dependent protease ClpP protease subunit